MVLDWGQGTVREGMGGSSGSTGATRPEGVNNEGSERGGGRTVAGVKIRNKYIKKPDL
jgi:hypothetical protein